VICSEDGAHKSNTLARFDPQKLDSVAFARKSDRWHPDGKQGFSSQSGQQPSRFGA